MMSYVFLFMSIKAFMEESTTILHSYMNLLPALLSYAKNALTALLPALISIAAAVIPLVITWRHENKKKRDEKLLVDIKAYNYEIAKLMNFFRQTVQDGRNVCKYMQILKPGSEICFDKCNFETYVRWIQSQVDECRKMKGCISNENRRQACDEVMRIGTLHSNPNFFIRNIEDINMEATLRLTLLDKEYFTYHDRFISRLACMISAEGIAKTTLPDVLGYVEGYSRTLVCIVDELQKRKLGRNLKDVACIKNYMNTFFNQSNIK